MDFFSSHSLIFFFFRNVLNHNKESLTLKSSEYNSEKKCHLRRSHVTVIDPVTSFWKWLHTLKKKHQHYITAIRCVKDIFWAYIFNPSKHLLVTTNLAIKNTSQRLKKNIRLSSGILVVTKPNNEWIRLIYYLIFLLLFLFSIGSLSLLSFSDFSFLSFLEWEGGANCWFTCCATSWETGRGFLEETPATTMDIIGAGLTFRSDEMCNHSV